jgi:ribosome-binding protein aMBF1 (putative translation factor)
MEDPMDPKKRTQLEAAGWTVGSADDFLELSAEEAAFVDLRLSLSQALKERRTRRRISQEKLARKIGSSQSRVAKMEASDPSVSVDLLIRALLAIGASPKDIAGAIERTPKNAA